MSAFYPHRHICKQCLCTDKQARLAGKLDIQSYLDSWGRAHG